MSLFEAPTPVGTSNRASASNALAFQGYSLLLFYSSAQGSLFRGEGELINAQREFFQKESMTPLPR